LKYIETYGLDGVDTMLRGTLRNEGFCSAWNIFVQLGCCDDSYRIESVSDMTHATFIDSFLPPLPDCETVLEKVCAHFSLRPGSDEIRKLTWSGFFDETPVGLTQGTPASILEHILNKKWYLRKEDKDQIVMWHRLKFNVGHEAGEIQASLVATGFDDIYTAMAKTVGLPLGIATKLIASGSVRQRGVIIPITPEFYTPILSELAALGITLAEKRIR
jgi:saccharopine dehydrogenase (NADP+, L-glutamate forming)